MSVAQVEVNFTASSSRSEFTQNDSNQGLANSKLAFRKNGRGNKERKKDLSASLSGSGSSGHRSLLLNPNDITGIPLKDDSSKASMPSQHFGPITVGFIDKGWTFAAHNPPLEIAMYVLLGVFSVAILVFVASCFVYASRVKKRDISNSDELMGFKMDQHNGFGMGRAGGGCTNAHDWVWLGRASLALHPSLDSTKHPAFKTNTNKAVCYDAKNGQNPSNPIRIINNPSFDSSQQQPQAGSSQQAGSTSSQSPQSLSQPGSSSRQFGRSGSGGSHDAPRLAPPPRPPKPTHQSSIDSATFSVKQQQQGGKVSSPPGSSMGSVGDCPDYRPPVPPHRNIPMGGHDSSGSISPPRGGSTKSGGSSSSSSQFPSSNSHNNNVSKNCKSSKSRKDLSDDLPNPVFVDLDFTEPQQQKNKRDQREPSGPLRPANIVGNPMTYIDEESEIDDDEDVERPLTVAAASAVAARQSHKMKNGRINPRQNNLNSSVKLDMDYDQLMEYFDNLKETEA